MVLALGANLGDRLTTLRAAVGDLGTVEGLRVVAVSAPVETAAVGGPPQPDYLNVVTLAETELSPLDLLDTCLRVEAVHGRTRDVRWGPRTLDLDIIRYGDLHSDAATLELPHPRAAQRAFVLAPWLDVDPGATLPGPAGPRAVADLLAAAPDRAGVRPWAGPGVGT